MTSSSTLSLAEPNTKWKHHSFHFFFFISVPSHRLHFQSFLEVPLPPLLVLLLPEEAVLSNHLLLTAHLKQLSGQTLLQLSLTRQTLHQLLVSACFLWWEGTFRVKKE